ncbi:MAG TPA: serine/threonine-protein kinase, partial [Phycisphaerales bacterium]
MSADDRTKDLSLEQRVARVLDDAGDMSGPSLVAFVRERCPNDPEVVREVEALFNLAGDENPILDSPEYAPHRLALDRLHAAIASKSDSSESPTSAFDKGRDLQAPLPQAIGPYRVVRLIGEGGMGLVYEAEQPSPKRRVAIKVIARGVATRAMLARFRNEAQVLGQLKHPGIAQIFEASTDVATGQAFFAMEYVEGPPLTRFVRDRGLSDRQRVDLLARVCDAVQHAHQKGVIHRDLKPGNILVEAASDGTYAPKVLDFGVAKLTNSEGESATLALDANRIVGTLGYMSPEQFEAKPEQVDTRSDVYALGVILYELLAEKLPLDLNDLTITQAATKVREQVPTKLGRVRPALSGDLEVIAAKALHKDREQRYSSAAELAADLRRFLAHEPITARPPGTLYTIRKFARRKPALTVISVGSVLALIGATAFSWVQYQRAVEAREAEAAQTVLANLRAQSEQEARERADAANSVTEAVKDYLVLQMIGAAAPDKMGYDVKVVDVLRVAEKGIAEAFSNSPRIQGELRYELGRIYNTLGMWSQSAEQHEKSIEIYKTLEGPDGVHVINGESQLAVAFANAGEQKKAMALFERIYPRFATLMRDEHVGRIAASTSYANMLQAARQFDKAEPIIKETIALADEKLPVGHSSRLNARATYLVMLNAMNRVSEVEPQLKQLLVEQEAANGKNHPLSLTTRNNLVNVLLRLKRDAEALQYAEGMIEQSEKIFPEGHTHRGIPLVTVAATLRRNARPAEAAPLAAKASDIFETAEGDFAFFAEKAADFAHLSFTDAGDATNARRWALRYAGCRFRFASDAERPTLKARLTDIAKSLKRERSDDDARKSLLELIAAADELSPPGNNRRARFLINLSRASIDLNQRDLAGPLLTKAEAELASSRNPDDDRKALDAT